MNFKPYLLIFGLIICIGLVNAFPVNDTYFITTNGGEVYVNNTIQIDSLLVNNKVTFSNLSTTGIFQSVGSNPINLTFLGTFGTYNFNNIGVGSNLTYSNVTLTTSFLSGNGNNTCNYTIHGLTNTFINDIVYSTNTNASTLLFSGNYSITSKCLGYVSQTKNITITNLSHSLDFSVFTENSISFNIYDKTTLALFDNKTTTINMIGQVYYQQLITNNGTGFAQLNPDTYQIILTTNTSGFTPLIYYITLNGQHETLNAYFEPLLNTVDFITKDATNQINLQGVYLQFYQNINGTSVNVGSCISDYQGQCITYLNPTTEYQITGVFTGYNDFSGRITPVLTTYNVNMQPSGSIDKGQDYFTSISVSNTLEYNGNNGFTFNYTDATNTITQGCLNVYKGSALFNNSCKNGSSNEIIVNITNSSNAYYTAQGIVFINNQSWLLKTANYLYPKAPPLTLDAKKMFMFLNILLTLCLSMLFLYSISVAFILAPLPTFFLSMFGMIPISPGAGVVALLIGLTLAVITHKRT